MYVAVNFLFQLSSDPGKVDSNFFCYEATVLSPHRNVLIFTQRMHKPTLNMETAEFPALGLCDFVETLFNAGH